MTMDNLTITTLHVAQRAFSRWKVLIRDYPNKSATYQRMNARSLFTLSDSGEGIEPLRPAKLRGF